MQILLINMERSADRLDFIRRRMVSLGLEFIRIPAVDGGVLSREEIETFVRARPRDGRRGWRSGQIGCFLSHTAAWRRIAEGQAEFGVVLEDDLHVSDEIVPFITTDAWIPADADIVRLETTGQWLRLGPSEFRYRGRAIQPLLSEAWGAGAYILRRSTARRLLDSAPVLHSPADDFLFNKTTSPVSSSLAIHQVVPALCVQDKFHAERAALGFGSHIEFDAINRRLSALSELRRTITSSLRGKTQITYR